MKNNKEKAEEKINNKKELKKLGIKSLLRKFNILPKISYDLSIDLGTANSLVYVKGRGIVISEPSVVALNVKTSQVLAVGKEAKEMVGKTPAHIMAVRPLVKGVISDFEVTEQMLRYFIEKIHREGGAVFWSRPRIVIGIPYGITEVEKKAVEDAALQAGARAVYLIEQPMAAALGARLPVQEPTGSFVVDIGGGTTEVAVISLGGIVKAKSLRVAGDQMTQDIINFVQEEYKLAIGERMAEEVKIAIGSAYPYRGGTQEYRIRGRNLLTGLPEEITITSKEIRLALDKSVKQIVDEVKKTIEETPPDLLSDIIHRGIYLAGGGSLLRGLEQLLEKETKIPTHLVEEPLTAVCRGAGMVIENIDAYEEVLVQIEEKEIE